MRDTLRSSLLSALRSAGRFEISEQNLLDCLDSAATHVTDPSRVANLEQIVRAAIVEGVPLPARARPAALPILGSIAEAVIEVTLADLGWQPVYDDDAGESYGHGVDLLMLEPQLERLFAIEVKSTIQARRWPRLSRAPVGQMSSAWLDKSDNYGMRSWEVESADVYAMVAQVHLVRRIWRACVVADSVRAVPVARLDELSDTTWLK